MLIFLFKFIYLVFVQQWPYCIQATKVACKSGLRIYSNVKINDLVLQR